MNQNRLFLAATCIKGLAGIGIGAGLLLMMAGCASGSPEPVRSAAAYVGPDMKLESDGGMWVVVVRSPSPGWKVRVDRRWEEYMYQGVYVSLTEPNPAFSYPSLPVQQRLATNLRSAQSVRLYVRKFDFTGQPVAGDDGYALVTSAEATDTH